MDNKTLHWCKVNTDQMGMRNVTHYSINEERNQERKRKNCWISWINQTIWKRI